MTIKPYYQDDYVTIYHGDCREILPKLDIKVDLVLTDPPYPDQHPEYGDCDISFLNNLNCRQLVFWSAKVDFPLDYTARHLWDKWVSCRSQYEYIYECNGQSDGKTFRSSAIRSRLAARFMHDTYFAHPSQKPCKVVDALIIMSSNIDDLILDPFLGSGTTAYCSKKLNRKCIGIEIEEKYCEIAAKRCSQMVMRL